FIESLLPAFDPRAAPGLGRPYRCQKLRRGDLGGARERAREERDPLSDGLRGDLGAVMTFGLVQRDAARSRRRSPGVALRHVLEEGRCPSVRDVALYRTPDRREERDVRGVRLELRDAERRGAG